MRTALTIFSTLFSLLAMVAAVLFYVAYQDSIPGIRSDADLAVSDIEQQAEAEIARLNASYKALDLRYKHEADRLSGIYQADMTQLRSEYDKWRAEESVKYQSAIAELKGEVERLRDDAVNASVTAARSEWTEAEQLATQVAVDAEGFDSRVDEALRQVDTAAFASAQTKLDDLNSRLNDLAALQQDIDDTLDAIHELCAGEKCGTVINIEAWTTTPATTLDAKRAAFSGSGTDSLTLEDLTLWNRFGGTYAVELEQLDVSPFGRPLAKLPNESDRIVGAYRVRIFEGTGSTDPVDVVFKPDVRFPNEYNLICLDDSRTWRQCDGLQGAPFHEGEGYTIALVRSE